MLAQDLRLALRRLRHNPLFSITVIGTLALGIGATTSMYTVVDGVLLKPLPFPEPEALVRVTADYAGIGLRDAGMSLPELDDYAQRSGAFEAIAGVWPITANLTGGDRPERVEVLLASPNYFELLGARAALGRTFGPGDWQPGIATVAVISDGLWRRTFGADPGVLGRKLRVDNDAYEIVGVMPPSFRHPSVTVETDVELWAPAGWKAAPFPPPAYSAKFIQSALGRLKPGVSLADARVRVESLGRALAREHTDDYPPRLGWTPRLLPLADDLVAGIRPVLWILMGAIACVLLIGVSSISNLLLARAASREREIAVQRALGADRRRVVAGLLVEGFLLAIIGGAVGLLISLWGVEGLLRLVPDRLPRMADIAVDRRAFVFALVVSAFAGVLAGLAPALQSSRTDIIAHLREGGRAVHGGRRSRMIRSALVVAQIAIAIVLLAGAGLFVRSLRNLQQTSTGVSLDRVMTARTWLPQPNDPRTGPYFEHAARVALIRNVLDRLRATPGVTAAGMATALPLVNDSGTGAFAAEGWTPDRRDLAVATAVAASDGYFRALGLQLVKGRLLTAADHEAAPRAVLVNERLANIYFPGEEVLNRRIRFIGRRGQVPAQAPWLTIVGVVRDVKEDGLDAPVRPQIYQSLWQVSSLALTMVAKGSAAVPPADVLRGALQQADPNLPIYAVRTGNELLAVGLAQRRFATTLVNAFAAAALFLATLGLHGVIAFGVRQRMHEFGLRVALGATGGRILALVMAQGARIALVGTLVGVAAALILSRFVSSLLFGISGRDPLTLAAVVALVASVVAMATFLAAWRAASVEGAMVLRGE